MRLSLLSLLFLAFVGLNSATVSFQYQKPQPGQAPFCTDGEVGKKRVGEEWHDMINCVRKMCLTDSQGTPMITSHSCGAVGVGAGCKLEKPTEQKPYPECCPSVVCN